MKDGGLVQQIPFSTASSGHMATCQASVGCVGPTSPMQKESGGFNVSSAKRMKCLKHPIPRGTMYEEILKDLVQYSVSHSLKAFPGSTGHGDSLDIRSHMMRKL